MASDSPTTGLPQRLRETFKAWGLRSLGDEAADEIERLREVRRASAEFVRFVHNNLPNLEPQEVRCLFGHLEWDELQAALKETS